MQKNVMTLALAAAGLTADTEHTQVKIAKITPPITGAGMQNRSKIAILCFKKFPNIKTTTATAIV